MQHALTKEEPANGKNARASWLVAPLAFQPLLVVAAIFWARFESIMLHPDRAARNPPTVSRAIADPAIGDIFANLVLVAAILQAFAVWRIVLAFSRSPNNGTVRALLPPIILCQAVAICGMVVLTQYTGSISDSLHTLGSYMLFFGQGVGITVSGVAFRMDRTRRADLGAAAANEAPAPYSLGIHPRLSAFVTVLSLIFGYLYYDFFNVRAFDDYAYRLTFAVVEVALLISFEAYLASFLAPMYRYERYRLVHRKA